MQILLGIPLRKLKGIIFCCLIVNSIYSNSNFPDAAVHIADTAKIVHTIFLFGDARRLYLNDDLKAFIQDQIDSTKSPGTILFLGDNAEPSGLPDDLERYRSTAEASLNAQIDIVKGYMGKTIFIPGNHDWNHGSRDGLDYIKNQRKYIENALDREDVFLPEKGRAGPIEVKLTKDIVLIVIDSQWWLQDFDKSYDGIEDEADFFVQLKDVINRNRNKKVIVAAHHPLYSVGEHGGRFPASYNLFPLLEANKYLYLPLPGFIYTGYRKFFGHKQDLAHPEYKTYKESLLEVIKTHPNLIFVAGHEHNLQYVEIDSVHHIISGSAGTATYVSKTKKADFAIMDQGFSKLNFYNNGDVQMEFWVASKDSEQIESVNHGELVFSKKLFNKTVYNKKEYKKLLSSIDFTDSLITTYPNGEKYQAGNFKKFMQGNNYRREWIVPVEVPVFDLYTEKGGLEIIQRGGGKQTTSLRMEDKDGRQWVLRSLEKDPSTGIPEAIKTKFTSSMVQDVISASIPYSALSVPRLADAVEIYHTNPKLVYLAEDPRLGKYYDDLAGGLYLFEERPTGNRKDIYSFGNSKKIVSSFDMIDNVHDDSDHRVDQPFLLKSRLFDVFINDWDRHEDQWRWATFKDDGLIIYRPVPRDRDQTFFVNEGIVPWIGARDFAYWKNQGFDYKIKDIDGLTLNARYIDRRFLNEMSQEDWQKAAKKMQGQLTDEVLHNAVYDMPKEIASINGDVIISKLKSRREDLPDYANDFYHSISKEVDVVGTDKDEYFLIERLNNDSTKVTVHTLNKKGKKKDLYYQRIFKHDETNEIRVYGEKGNDKFKITGNVDKGIKIRVVGGRDKDKITDESFVKGISKKTLIYDSRKKNDIKFGKESRNLTSNRKELNKYDYYAFKHNKFMPLIGLGYNVDDGIFIGGGFSYKTQGFKKEPFAWKHKLIAKYAIATKSAVVDYSGIYTSAIRDFDLHLDLGYYTPVFTQNFFGWGNETEITTDNKDYNRVRIDRFNIATALSNTFGEYHTIMAGLVFYTVEVEETEGRFISDIPANGLNPGIFNKFVNLGIDLSYTLDTRNNTLMPSRGIYWNTSSLFSFGLNDSTGSFNKIKSDMSIYLSLRSAYRFILELRFGGAVNSGDYEFFVANSLGGKTNLRGYRETRFSGDASFYQNTNLRIKLFRFKNSLAKGEIGTLFFNDVGRVWLHGENSGKWHQGYGAGLWLSPFDMAVITASYDMSKEANIFSMRFIFSF